MTLPIGTDARDGEHVARWPAEVTDLGERLEEYAWRSEVPGAVNPGQLADVCEEFRRRVVLQRPPEEKDDLERALRAWRDAVVTGASMQPGQVSAAGRVKELRTRLLLPEIAAEVETSLAKLETKAKVKTKVLPPGFACNGGLSTRVVDPPPGDAAERAAFEARFAGEATARARLESATGKPSGDRARRGPLADARRATDRLRKTEEADHATAVVLEADAGRWVIMVGNDRRSLKRPRSEAACAKETELRVHHGDKLTGQSAWLIALCRRSQGEAVDLPRLKDWSRLVAALRRVGVEVDTSGDTPTLTAPVALGERARMLASRR